MEHYSKWFVEHDNIKPKYSLGFFDGLNLIGTLCGFKSKDKCKEIIDDFIKNDTFFKLFQNGEYILLIPKKTFKKGQKIQRYLSIFQLLIFSLKEFKDKYWYRCGVFNNLLNDILQLTECLLQLSSRQLDYTPDEYNELFTKFKDTDILNYTSSYDIILKENTSFTINEVIADERNRIYELKNKDNEYNVFKNIDEKEMYYLILDNIQNFIGNIQNQISNIPENSFNRIKSKTESSREVIEGIVKLKSKSISMPSSRSNSKSTPNNLTKLKKYSIQKSRNKNKRLRKIGIFSRKK